MPSRVYDIFQELFELIQDTSRTSSEFSLSIRKVLADIELSIDCEVVLNDFQVWIFEILEQTFQANRIMYEYDDS